MKIIFDTLTTNRKEIEVKADDYKSVYFDAESAKTDGVELSKSVFTSLETIKLGTSKIKPSFTEELNTKFINSLHPYTKVKYSELWSYYESLEPNAFNDDPVPYDIMVTDYDYSKRYIISEGDDPGPVATTHLFNVWIPKDTEVLGDGIFCNFHLWYWNPYSCENICYEGTVEEFSEIEGCNNYYNVICSDGIFNLMMPENSEV